MHKPPEQDPVNEIAASLHQLLDKQESFDLLIRELLSSARHRLGMEVAFVSEFAGSRRVFRYVDSSAEIGVVCVGAGDPLDASYCQRVVDGRLPQLIRNAHDCSAALELPITTSLPIGAHLSVPIRLADGHVYGTFCCFSRAPKATLNERDLAVIRVFGDVTAALLEANWDAVIQTRELRREIESILDEQRITMLFQPVVALGTGDLLGFEALPRVLNGDWRPDQLFAEAARLKLEARLGELGIAKALEGFWQLPENGFLALNLSPEFALHERLTELLAPLPPERLVLEITEHAVVADYPALNRALAPLRQAGARLAVDDVGAGYSSLRHILNLEPDILKLDMSLTRDIDSDEQRRILTTALTDFAGRRGYAVIAEGIETAAERDTLQALGVGMGQGYLLGRPQPAAAWSSE